MERYGLGYGDTNSLVHYALQSDGQDAAESTGLSDEEVLSEIYNGSKAPLRPIRESVMTAIQTLGPFDIVPKKGYVSLRRKKFSHGRPGQQMSGGVGVESEGIGSHIPAGGAATRQNVPIQSVPDRPGRDR
jgi:hypothetical protein